MKPVLAAGIAVLTLAACNKPADRDSGSAIRHSADTIVSKREMQDTAIIRHDTTIVNDTTHRRGKRPVDTDTVKKP
jgi:hypothetical protein